MTRVPEGVTNEVERVACALWEDWRLNGKTAKAEHRDVSWLDIKRWAATNEKMAMVRDDAYSQAIAAMEALKVMLELNDLARYDPAVEWLSRALSPSTGRGG